MKIFADENIPGMTVRALREAGHEVLDIRGTAQEGMDDDAVWELAHREKRLLITTDKRFARNRYEKHSGILIVRLKQPNKHKIHEKVMSAMNRYREWTGLTVAMRDRFHSIWRVKRKNRNIAR